MHRHFIDPRLLKTMVPQFSSGEFILKKGWGKEAEMYCGKIDRVEVPDSTIHRLLIHCHLLYKRKIGCSANFSPRECWCEAPIPVTGMPFDYSWFYPQKRHDRLKLERADTSDRCWLCSATDPIHLELFRSMLITMFLKESLQKTAWLKKLRNRLLLCR